MQSDKKKKNKKEPKVKIAPPSIPKTDTKEEESSSNFDFGGLPARDLKKNLGCG